VANEIIKLGESARVGLVKSVTQRLYQAYEAFFGPLLPLPQQTPASVPVRSVDYQAGVNLDYIPRGQSDVTFAQLRGLADGYYLIRLIIETRKDQVRKLDWRIGLKMKTGESTSIKDIRRKSEGDPRVQQIEKLFRFPDGFNDWGTWIGKLLEDVFVIDAPCLSLDRTNDGEVYRFRQIDGSTVHPIWNPEGITPQHPETAYQQIIKGMVSKNLTTRDLIYFPRNPRVNKLYGFSPVEQMILIVNLGIRRALHQIAFYTAGNIPEALVMVPDSWDPDQIKQFQAWFDSKLAGNLAERRKITFLPGGGGKSEGKASIEFTKDRNLKDEMDEYLARVCCFCFSLPPTAFVRQMNRASAEQQQKTAIEEGLEPIKRWIADKINYLIQAPHILNQPEIEFSWDDEPEVDPAMQANIDKIYVSTGIRSIDEIRERDGLDPIGVKNGVITATGFIPFKDGRALATDYVTQQPGQGPQPSDGKNKPGSSQKRPAKAAQKTADVSKQLSSHCAAHESFNPACEHCMAKEIERVEKAVTELCDGTPLEKVEASYEVSLAHLPARVTKRMDSLANRIARYLQTLGKRAAVQVGNALGHVAKDEQSEADHIMREVELDWAGLVATVENSLEVTAHESANATAEVLGANGRMGAIFQEAVDYAKARSAEMVGLKWVDDVLVDNPAAQYSINQTTRDEIRSLIVKALEEGMTPAEVEKAIRQLGAFSASRAAMIAQTELSAAHVQGALAAAKHSRVATKKYSMLGSQHDADDECDDNVAAGDIGIDESFPSGHSGPPFHPNCVCGIGFRFKE
jgi:HK97 family phage portal protein